MATDFITDSFTDADSTLIESHAPDLGGTWVPQNTGSIDIQSGAIEGPAFGNGKATNDATPPSADYGVGCTVTLTADTGTEAGGVFVRTLSNFGDGYRVVFSTSDHLWHVDLLASFTFYGLDTFADAGFTAGGSRTCALEFTGPGWELFVGGVSVLTGTDGSVSAANFAGVSLEEVYSGSVLLDSFHAYSGGGGGVHAGLTGNGTLAVSPISAINIDITTLPSNLGTGKGNPIRYFEMGNVAFGIGGYFGRNYYLEHEAERVMVPFPSVDTIAYSVRPDAVMTITEVP